MIGATKSSKLGGFRHRPAPIPARVLAVVSCLVCTLTSCTAPHPASGRAAVPEAAPTNRWTVLQFNLCNSGIASCYTGRAVNAAAAIIRDSRPDVVTLNEVCRIDVTELARAMAQAQPGMVLRSAFEAAVDRRTNGPYRCRNGQPYGIGVLAVDNSAATQHRTFSGRYPIQDLSDPEERVWVCIHAALGYACTTHTASTSAAVALAQCRYLTRTALPALQRRTGGQPLVVGADLNLPEGRSPGVPSCVGDGYGRADDGARQDVLTSAGLRITGRAVIGMHGTTDHPALLVRVLGARTRQAQSRP